MHVHQLLDVPTLHLQDGTRPHQQVGLSAANVAQNVLISLSGSFADRADFLAQSAQRRDLQRRRAVAAISHDLACSDLLNIPVSNPQCAHTQLLGNLAQVTPVARPAVVSHYNVQPVIDVYASAQDRDLGGVAASGHRRSSQFAKHLPRGTQLIVRGQVETMQSSFIGLGVGLLCAIVLVYLLIVVNFQSWLDPFIIITALPGALAGICWMLFLTRTTLSVPSLTGAIMCMGVATANSILMVSFRARPHEAGHPGRGSRSRSRLHAHPAGADDRAGDDHRHDADGAGPGRRRRAERAPGTRRDRRPDVRHRRHAVLRAYGLCHDSRAQGSQRSAESEPGMKRHSSSRMQKNPDLEGFVTGHDFSRADEPFVFSLSRADTGAPKQAPHQPCWGGLVREGSA